MILKLIIAVLFNYVSDDVCLLIRSKSPEYVLRISYKEPHGDAKKETGYVMEYDGSEGHFYVTYTEEYTLSKTEAYLWYLVIQNQIEHNKFNQLKKPT